MHPEHSLPVVSAWDEARIARLVARHQRGVAAYLASAGAVAADVDDLVQETFLVLLGVPFEERSHAATAAFLRRIARNLFLKRVRVGRREVVDLDAIEAAWVAFDSGDGGDAYLVALRHCLAGLGASSRLALELRYRDALSPGAIADRLGLSLGGARSVLLRAKARLRACISQRIEP